MIKKYIYTKRSYYIYIKRNYGGYGIALVTDIRIFGILVYRRTEEYK